MKLSCILERIKVGRNWVGLYKDVYLNWWAIRAAFDWSVED